MAKTFITWGYVPTFLHHMSQFFQPTAWPHWISEQVLSSHLIVSSSRTVRPCSPSWGGRLTGHEKTWLTVCSSAPHSQAAEKAIPHLCKQEWKRLTPVRRWLSWIHAIFSTAILWGWVPMSGMKVQSLVVLSNPGLGSGSWGSCLEPELSLKFRTGAQAMATR